MIELRVLGGLDLRGEDGAELRDLLVGPKRVALLSYLILKSPGGFQRRDTLVGLLWPELDQVHARSSLRNLLYLTRRRLGDGVLISRGDEELGVDDTRLWCDAVAFRRKLRDGRLENALELYRGDLLPGFFVDGALKHDRWLEEERRDLREKASAAAWALADQMTEARDPASARSWGGRALTFSPYDEEAVRRLMTICVESGDRAAALAVYEEFRSRLATDLELTPSEKTRTFVERLRGAGPIDKSVKIKI